MSKILHYKMQDAASYGIITLSYGTTVYSIESWQKI